MGAVFIGWSTGNTSEIAWTQLGLETAASLIESLAHHKEEARQYRIKHTGNKCVAVPGGLALT